jgi:hypothetical protein
LPHLGLVALFEVLQILMMGIGEDVFPSGLLIEVLIILIGKLIPPCRFHMITEVSNVRGRMFVDYNTLFTPARIVVGSNVMTKAHPQFTQAECLTL